METSKIEATVFTEAQERTIALEYLKEKEAKMQDILTLCKYFFPSAVPEGTLKILLINETIDLLKNFKALHDGVDEPKLDIELSGRKKQEITIKALKYVHGLLKTMDYYQQHFEMDKAINQVENFEE